MLATGFAARWSSLLRPPPTPSRPPHRFFRFCRLWAGIASRSAVVGRWSSARPDGRATHGQPVTLWGHVAAASWIGRLCLHPSPASGPRRVSPVPRTTFWPFNALYAGEFLGTRSRFLGCFPWPSPFRYGLGSLLVRLSTGNLTTLTRASLPLQTGQLLAPFQGLRCSASTAGSHPTPGAVLSRTLASPRTRLALAGSPELVARVCCIDHPLSGLSLRATRAVWTHT